MPNWIKIKVPEKPTNSLVHVTNVSPNTTEKAVREFFSFCGKIIQFELARADQPDEGQEALILFEKETAASTACMLTQAILVDRQIVVSPYFRSFSESSAGSHDPNSANSNPSSSSYETMSQEEKSKSSIVSELLAQGYVLSDNILKVSSELDSKYGVSSAAQEYINQAKERAVQIDEKYGIKEKASHAATTVQHAATALDEKYKLREMASATYLFAASAASAIGNKAMQTTPVQKVTNIVSNSVNAAVSKVAEIQKDATRIKGEKMREQESNGTEHGGSMKSTPKTTAEKVD